MQVVTIQLMVDLFIINSINMQVKTIKLLHVKNLCFYCIAVLFLGFVICRSKKSEKKRKENAMADGETNVML